MGLALTTALAFCLWVILWAIGVRSLDAMLITLLILVIAGTIKSLGKFLPGTSQRGSADGGW